MHLPGCPMQPGIFMKTLPVGVTFSLPCAIIITYMISVIAHDRETAGIANGNH